jgi:dATP pyrophosphohydrolase
MQEIPIRCHAVSLVAVRTVNGENEVLLLRRTRSLRGEWCQIAGAIEHGETAWQAAVRELAEETGLVPITLHSGDICEQFYEAHLDAISILPVFVATIDSASSVQLNPEHSEYRWVSFSEADGMVPFAGQRKILRHVEAEFMLRVPSHHLAIKVT